jgi:hypothetical protein
MPKWKWQYFLERLCDQFHANIKFLPKPCFLKYNHVIRVFNPLKQVLWKNQDCQKK